jgi:hypothetical protein
MSGSDLKTQPVSRENPSQIYEGGLLKAEHLKYQARANYEISARLDPTTKSITVQEHIVWINKTHFPADEIQFHLYPNAYKNNKTIFAQAYPIDRDAETHVEIQTFRVNDQKAKLIYFRPDIPDPHDSTVAKVSLDESVLPGDSVKIYFEYTLKIPRSVKRFGYATGRDFFFISQWFPKAGVFENGKWICSQYHPYLNFYSDFGNYSVRIKVPSNYKVAASGSEKERITEKYFSTYLFTQDGVHDFAWMASDEILHRADTYYCKHGTAIAIQAFVQPEHEKYIPRYFDAVKNCLRYFEDNIGTYPYENITLVDVPRTSASGGMEYPTLFTVSAELISPKESGWPEYLVAHEFSHQFFQGLLANNEVYEAWLDEGFASYAATKIMYAYYAPIFEEFKLASYIPIFGLNFLSYNEIPLIYTLVNVQIPQGSRSAVNYYKNLTIGTLADTSYKLPTRLSYVVNSYSKPELVLLTLENYLGAEKMKTLLKDYYENYKFKHPTARDFIETVKRGCREDMGWFFNEFYSAPKVFDYKITSVKKAGPDIYEVLAERMGDGFFKNEIALYTDKDTLYQMWDTNERWKIFKFKTSGRVVAAEIDPHRKNLLDINFANNSYTVENRYWASLSLVTRWFFWVQNALMILGSIG